MLRFFRTTVLGGILFLVPVIIFIAIAGKALQIIGKLAVPVAGLLGIDTIGGIAVAELLAIGMLVLICFLAGLVAESQSAKNVVKSLEENVLDKIPAYGLLKFKSQSALGLENEEDISPVAVRFDDSWQLAFEVERVEGGNVVIFLPGAPDPWSGSVCVVTGDRITPLDMTVSSAVNLMQHCGKGQTDDVPNPWIFGQPSV